MTQKCLSYKISNNYFSRRSHILMWLTPGELGDHWTDDLLTSKLWVTIGPILFSSGTIESFYSVPATSRWPHIIIATFFVSFYLVVNFWFVCYCIIGIYLLPRQDIFGIVSSWRTNCRGGQRVAWWEVTLSPLITMEITTLLLSKLWEVVITVIQSSHQQHKPIN